MDWLPFRSKVGPSKYCIVFDSIIQDRGDAMRGILGNGFFRGNNDGAKKQVAGILERFGCEHDDIDGIEGARLLEPMCILWVLHGIRSGSWHHAFKLPRG
jgi:hypothetical protein